METEAKVNGYYELPAQYNGAATLAKHGHWDVFVLRATPHWLMERVRFIWHLDYLCNEKQNKDTEREARAASGKP